MKNLLLPAFCFLIIVLSSCQKGVKDIYTNSNQNPSLLLKTVSVTGSFSDTTLYSYDNQERLETITVGFQSPSQSYKNSQKFSRDIYGRIIKITRVTEQNMNQPDTSIELIYYPSSAMEYDYTVDISDGFGFLTYDTTVFTYSAGKIMSSVSRLTSPFLASSREITSKIDYTYDSLGRVSTMKFAVADQSTSGILVDRGMRIYTYGNILNPIWTTTNAAQNLLLLGMPSIKNEVATKIENDDFISPSNNVITTMNYAVNANNKPVSAISTSTNGLVKQYAFYYQ